MAHPVVWFEVLGRDGDRLRQFYGGLFGWGFDVNNPMKYGMVDTGDPRGIPGGVGEAQRGGRPWVTFYVETPDVAATLDVQQRGGKVIMPRSRRPRDRPGRGQSGLARARGASARGTIAAMRRADRLFQIIQFLRRRRPAATARLIAERLGVSERTVVWYPSLVPAFVPPMLSSPPHRPAPAG